MSKFGYDKSGKYIDLKINGRLFPSWVMANFKKYKLDEVFKRVGEDPCNIKEKKEGDKDVSLKLELRKYQLFLSSFLDFRSPYREILVFHGLGEILPELAYIMFK